MADLIKVGNIIFNEEFVVDYELGDEQVIVRLAVSRGNNGSAHPHYHTFKGDEAKVLREWLENRTRDLVALAASPATFGI